MCKPSKANPSIRPVQLWYGWRGSHPEQSPSRLSLAASRLHSCFPSRAPAADPPGMPKGRRSGAPVIGYLKWTWTPSLTRVIQTVAHTLFSIQHKQFTFQDTRTLKPDGVCMKTVVTDSIWHPSAHLTVPFYLIFFFPPPAVDSLLKLSGAFLSTGANVSGMTVLSLWVHAQGMKTSSSCDKERDESVFLENIYLSLALLQGSICWELFNLK